EADNVACDRAAWAEHIALRLMAEALAAPPPTAPAPSATAAPPAPEPAPSETVAPAGLEPELITAAERYAARYPERAAKIRRTGKLPPDIVYFDPPEDALGTALIMGRTPALAALDGLPTCDANRVPDRPIAAT